MVARSRSSCTGRLPARSWRRLRAQLGEAAFAAGNFERAAKILDQITTADAFETFLTLPAYRAID